MLDALALQNGEEYLDLVDTTGVWRREVDDPSGMSGEPDLGVVRAVTRSVVENNVDLHRGIEGPVDLVEELAEVLRVVLSRDRFGEHLAGVDVAGSGQRRGAVADVLPLAESSTAWWCWLVFGLAFFGLH